MGFWLFVALICTVILFVKISNLRRDHDTKIDALQRELFELRSFVEAQRTPIDALRRPAASAAEREKAAPAPVRETTVPKPPPPVIVTPLAPLSPEASGQISGVPVTGPLSEEASQQVSAAPKPGPVPERAAAQVSNIPVPDAFSAQSSQYAAAASSGGGSSSDEPKAGAGMDLLKRWENFKSNVDWELFTGVKLFAGLGGIALFIGAGFFVKYSIDRNLIPPAMRLAVSAFIGIMLIIASGRFDRERFSVLRHTLGAGGIGVLYSVAFAATLYYEYLSRPAGFALLSVVSAAAFVLAVYFRGIPISVLGALGAYLTPVLVSTGQGTLTSLFVYLAIVNVGLFQVVRRLSSAALLLLATAGTLCTLFLGAFAGRIHPTNMEIAWIWIANMALFSYFLDSGKESSEGEQLLDWAGSVLYLSAPVAAVLLLRQTGTAPLLIATAGMAGAVVLAFRDSRWFSRVIPYSAVMFGVAFAWAWMCFDPRGLSWSFVVLLVYGAVGGLGPVVLIRKYGLDSINLRWFRVFPATLGVMVLAVVLRQPDISFWLWPLFLLLGLMGILISIVFGAMLQAALLVLFLIISGLSWLFRMPPGLGGPVFFWFVLFAGTLTGLAIVAAFKKTAEWRKTLVGEAELDTSWDTGGVSAEWMSALPITGAFILLGVTFWLQRPLEPAPGMFTLTCFLGISIVLSRRLLSQTLISAVLLSSLIAQGVWVFRPGLDEQLFFSALAWSGAFFGVAIVAPFLLFRSFAAWSRVWMNWALYEVVQGLFVIWSADHLWPREMSGWLPLVLACIKLPVVALLLRRLKDLPGRNAILAFHGGVLLFYVSAVPVMLLDQGWLGLTFVIEASLLLWLNRRVAHEGLRWVAACMAPLGLLLLFFALPVMKAPGDMVILNSAVLAVAAAVAALAAAVRLCGFPQHRLGTIELPDYFRWLAVGTGFFLLNLCITDLFAEAPSVFRLVPGPDALQAVCYGLVWLGYGAALWSSRSLSAALRHAGLIVLCTGTAGIILLPSLFPRFVPAMQPLWNIGLPVYLLALGILAFLIRRELAERVSRSLYNLLLTLLLLTGFMAVKVEMSTVVQPGSPFNLFFHHTPAMAVGSAAGWLAYGLGLLLWPRGLDRPFRRAGVVLVGAGLLKALAFPFAHAEAFGAMTPLLNTPSLLYLFALAALACLTLDRPKQHWPFETPSSRGFWGLLLAVVTFCSLNIEISSVFSPTGRPFTLLTRDNLAHQLAYSLGWLVYSIGLLVVGIKWSSRTVRWAALVVMVGTSFKIFFMDLWRLGQLYRVASFVGLAAVLILVSFLYQRFLAAREAGPVGQQE
jgi:uncharacterized membrane protein